MSTTRPPMLVAAAVAALLATSVLVTPRGAADESMLPPPPPVPLEVRDAERMAAHTAAGITVSAGWEPTVVFASDDPWGLFDERDGVRGWIDELPRLRLAYDRAGRLLVEDAAVVTDPARCYHLSRVVRRVGVGLPPPAGPAIAEQLEAWLEPPYFSAGRAPAGVGPCTGTDRSRWGFAIEQAEPLECAVPGRDVWCATLAKWRSDFGQRDEWTATHRAFDVRTGERLSDDELHPDLDLVAFDVLVNTAVCVMGGSCDGVAAREGRIHPTRTSLVVELSPGEAAQPTHGSLRLSIPRHILPLTQTSP
jgi:hypothetical protein